MYVSRHELSSSLLWLIPPGMNERRHHEKCPSFPACPGIQNREQKLILMVCLSYWTIFPFLRRHRHKGISTSNVHQPLWNTYAVWYDGLCATILYFFILFAVFSLFSQAVRCLGQRTSKFYLVITVKSPLSAGLWGTTRVNINIHVSVVKYSPLTIRSPN